MSEKRSPFESRDLTSGYGTQLGTTGRPEEKSRYRGKERRYHSQRTTKDRRSEVRFEIDKADRRQNHGRRCDDGVDISR